MKSVDFSTYKFRCSALKHLMVLPKTKAAREAGELSESTKTYLRDIFIKEVYDRSQPDIESGPTEKGTAVESDSIELLKEATGELYFKNNTEFSNEFIKGTPDITPSKSPVLKDIKSSWTIWTFAAVDQKVARDRYYYQVLGYMWLTGKTSADLSFCLTNTPEHIMFRETRKLAWSMDEAEAEAIIRKNHTYDDIPAKERVKQFHFEYSPEDVDLLQSQILKAREYLTGMSL